MGGSWKKPAGHTIVPEAGVLLLLPDDSSVTKVGQRLVHTYLKSLLKVPGLGRSSSSQLATRGILTLGQLRKASLEEVSLITVGYLSCWSSVGEEQRFEFLHFLLGGENWIVKGHFKLAEGSCLGQGFC